jgi:hypothetical protein
MEDWQLDFEWLRVRHLVKDLMELDKLPDLQAILFLIGVQELGQVKYEFSKEEKQDLMHIAVCTLLAEDGYFEFEGLDAERWPHWKQLLPLPQQDLKLQEQLLKQKVIAYFAKLNA